MSGADRALGGVLLLAAGRSRRFGSDKRAHVLADGRTLFEQSLALYAGAFDNCIVVIRSDDPAPRLPMLIAHHTTIVRAFDADLGMGHSLAAGARAAAAAGWVYAFVALADMPWADPSTLRQLRDQLEESIIHDPASIVIPLYEGHAGHPVGFGHRLFGELGDLSGDTGARSVIARHPQEVRRIIVHDEGVIRDLDTSPDQDAQRSD